MKKCILLTLLLCFLQNSFAQELDKVKLDNYFDVLEMNNKFMGSIAISQNGKIVYKKSVGFSDVENKIQADENTKYRIGSISKTFTSVITFKAIEENKLQLTQTIEKYFPTIKDADKITIEHLLRHRSGIHNYTNYDFLKWNTQPKTEEEMIKIISSIGSDFEPDSKAAYSNSNYILLTYILERSFNKSYRQLLTEYIIEPLRLKNTYLGSEIKIENKEAKSYKLVDSWKLEPETDISVVLGAGGIVSTPQDLVVFNNALFGGKLLKNESLEQMKSIKDNYGLGVMSLPFDNQLGYSHTGGIDGFSSISATFPENNISFAFSSNGMSYIGSKITKDILSAIHNKHYDIPEFSSYKVSPEELDKYVGEYSSEQVPLKITILKENKTLIVQGTGQPSFPLEIVEEHKFKFEQLGLVMEFNPTDNSMTLKQKGGKVDYTKY